MPQRDGGARQDSKTEEGGSDEARQHWTGSGNEKQAKDSGKSRNFARDEDVGKGNVSEKKAKGAERGSKLRVELQTCFLNVRLHRYYILLSDVGVGEILLCTGNNTVPDLILDANY
jgi:hypothetical protein